MRIIAKRFDAGQSVVIEIEANHVRAISPADKSGPETSLFVAPGLIDLQVNGFNGIDFSSLDFDVQQADSVAAQIVASGVTQFLPTVTTNSFEGLRDSMVRLAGAFEGTNEFKRIAAGIHLEGPYISPEDGPRGAHPKRFCRPPDWIEFQKLQDASGDRIKLVTLSPEYESAPEFIEKAVAVGIRVAIGHTNANTGQIASAVSAGATLSTHLGNGAHGTIRRHPNYIWDQLADDQLTATLIADGHHLPPNVVKSFVRCKGIERTILVSDITSLSGKPPGVYSNTVLGDVEVLEGGKLVVAGQRQYLAGASMPLVECVGIAVKFAEVDFSAAIKMATVNPSRAMGWKLDDFSIGNESDFIIYRDRHEAEAAQRIEVVATICNGEVVFDRFAEAGVQQ